MQPQVQQPQATSSWFDSAASAVKSAVKSALQKVTDRGSEEDNAQQYNDNGHSAAPALPATVAGEAAEEDGVSNTPMPSSAPKQPEYEESHPFKDMWGRMFEQSMCVVLGNWLLCDEGPRMRCLRVCTLIYLPPR